MLPAMMPPVAEQYLKKGSKVYLEGQLQTRKWQDKQGQDRYSTEVVLQGWSSNLTMLDGRSGGMSESQSGYSSGGDYAQQGSGGGSGATNGVQEGTFEKELDDEIPF